MMVAHRRRKTLERKCGNEVALVIKRTFADYTARSGVRAGCLAGGRLVPASVTVDLHQLPVIKFRDDIPVCGRRSVDVI
jgi:hypothetical protein